MTYKALALVFGIAAAAGMRPARAQTVDIRSFGPRCDGRSDDSGAVNAAFSSLPDGGTLQISCSLGVSDVALRDKTGVIVEGTSGGGFVAVGSNSTKAVVRVENCEGCTIRGLSINANYVGAAGLGISSSRNSTIENNAVYNVGYPAQAGIVAMGNQNNRYVGNSVTKTTGNGSDGTRGIWIGNGSAGSPDIEWNPVVADNTLRDIAATALVGHTAGGTFTGNTVEGTRGAGIKVTPPSGGGQTTIRDNTIRGNLFQGIQIDQADTVVIIENNRIVDNAGAGIYIAGSMFPNGRIAGNTISGNKVAGIYLYDGRGSVVHGNSISGGGNGIILEALPGSAFQGVQIANNTIEGVGGDGVALWGRGGSISGLTVDSNSIHRNARYGMSIEERNTGAISGVSLNGNCFAQNSGGALLDLRASNRLSGPDVASSCGAASAPSQAATPLPPTPSAAPAPAHAPAPFNVIRVRSM